MTDPLTDLIARLETATAEEQDGALMDAIDCANARGWITGPELFKADRWRAYGAYESAALVLLPDGWSVSLNAFPIESGKPHVSRCFLNGDGKVARNEEHCATPALAIAAASIRAHMERADAE